MQHIVIRRMTLTTVDDLVLYKVHSPCSLPQGKLVCKSNTETREIPRAGNPAAEIDNQQHFFNGEHQRRE